MSTHQSGRVQRIGAPRPAIAPGRIWASPRMAATARERSSSVRAHRTSSHSSHWKRLSRSQMRFSDAGVLGEDYFQQIDEPFLLGTG
jgi:hypothetical protein